MGRKSDAEIASGIGSTCERLIKGRMRFKHEHTADIVAWLILQHQSYDKAAQTTREAHRKNPLPGIKALAEQYESRASLCLELAQKVTDAWSKVDWLGIVSKMTGA